MDIAFTFLSATKSNQGRIQMTPEMLSLQWNTVSLYPAGYFTRGISVAATVKYPAGWTAYSGLPSNATGSSYAYQKTDYETLIDSPRSEEHTSELQSLMRISYAVFCLKKKIKTKYTR